MPSRPTPPIPEEEGKGGTTQRAPTPGAGRVRRWGRSTSAERDKGKGKGQRQQEVFSAYGRRTPSPPGAAVSTFDYDAGEAEKTKVKKPDPA